MDTNVGELRLEQPTVKQFRRISPSRYAAMKACLLKETWNASGNAPLLPPSPRAELGSIAHKMLEAAGRGELSDIRSGRVAEMWDALVSESEACMELSPLRHHQVPLCRSVPDFQVRRLRTCNRVSEIALDVHRSPNKHPGKTNYLTGFEIWVESEDGKVGGFIDHANVTTEGIVLSDYKSGSVLESEDEACPGELKQEYRIQMDLYAALYWQKTGIWPVKLNIIPLQGEPLNVEFDHTGAANLLDEAKAFLQFANERIAGVREGINDISNLAAAKPEHCRICLFRPACTAYWVARQRDTNGKWPVDVFGVVQDSQRLRNGKVCLRIGLLDFSTPSYATIRGITEFTGRHPLITHIHVGTRIAVYGLKRDNRSSDYTETQNTVIYRLD